MDLTQIRICIFDVNGVLIDSNRANAMAMARAFTDDPALRERIVELYLGLTGVDRGSKIRIIQERLVGSPLSREEFAERWDRFSRFGLQSMLEAPLTLGCREVLRELGRLGITRAALSNTPLPQLRETLSVHGLDSLLDLIRGGGDWPKSESLARLLEEKQLGPSACLFFGDGKGDLRAAVSAGVPFAAIDPATGEFDGVEGILGPYRSLGEWGEEVLGPARHDRPSAPRG